MYEILTFNQLCKIINIIEELVPDKKTIVRIMNEDSYFKQLNIHTTPNSVMYVDSITHVDDANCDKKVNSIIQNQIFLLYFNCFLKNGCNISFRKIDILSLYFMECIIYFDNINALYLDFNDGIFKPINSITGQSKHYFISFAKAIVEYSLYSGFTNTDKKKSYSSMVSLDKIEREVCK